VKDKSTDRDAASVAKKLFHGEPVRVAFGFELLDAERDDAPLVVVAPRYNGVFRTIGCEDKERRRVGWDAEKVHARTRGGVAGESGRGVSGGRGSVEIRRIPAGAQGRRNRLQRSAVF
jgi:hypothetical protein